MPAPVSGLPGLGSCFNVENSFSDSMIWFSHIHRRAGCFSDKEMKGSDRKPNYFQVHWKIDSWRFLDILIKFSYTKIMSEVEKVPPHALAPEICEETVANMCIY